MKPKKTTPEIQEAYAFIMELNRHSRNAFGEKRNYDEKGDGRFLLDLEMAVKAAEDSVSALKTILRFYKPEEK